MEPKTSIEFRRATWYHTGERARIDGMKVRLWANYTGRVTTENA